MENDFEKPGCVVWITGLSGSGKTTLAVALRKEWPDAILLDGDDLRKALGMENCAFDKRGRKNLAFIYARLAQLIASQGFRVIVATISLFNDVHAWNRDNIPNYMEIFMDVPYEERARRDPKGLYAAEKSGMVQHMAGGSTQVELPLASHLRFDGSETVEECVRRIGLVYGKMSRGIAIMPDYHNFFLQTKRNSPEM